MDKIIFLFDIDISELEIYLFNFNDTHFFLSKMLLFNLTKFNFLIIGISRSKTNTICNKIFKGLQNYLLFKNVNRIHILQASLAKVVIRLLAYVSVNGIGIVMNK